MLSVEIIGVFGKGATRWINLFGFSIQPSELIKITIILALARFYHDLKFDEIKRIKNLFFPILILFLPFAFVVIQPDLGTALSIAMLGILILFASGIRIWKFVLGFFVLILSIPLLLNYLQPYQKDRIFSFLNPEADALGRGYQLIQSKIALGSGGLTGKGFLEGSQSYLQYLPEKQTDFVFTMIGEEFGLVGNLFILGLYLALSLSILRISYLVRSRFSQLTCMGISMMLFFYVFVNVAMVSGMLPVVGAPLPLISYGGTSMLTVFIGLGIVTSILIHDRQED